MPADCGCGRVATSLVQQLTGTAPVQLRDYPDCTEMYAGTPRVLYIVARGTVNERLYAGYDAGEAAVYAGQYSAALELVNAYRLCAEAVAKLPA